MQKDDSYLIDLYKSGDKSAFSKIFKSNQKLVYTIISQHTKDKQTADDYSQEVWARILEKISLFKGGDFSSWLVLVTRNFCIDKFRSRKKKGLKEILIDPADLKKDVNISNHTENNWTINNEETWKDVSDGLSSLSKTQMDVLLLRTKGIKYDEISKILGISKGTCQPAYQAAIIKIRDYLIDIGKLDKKFERKGKRRLK